MKFPQIKHRSWIAFYLITLSFMTVWFVFSNITEHTRDMSNIIIGALLGGVVGGITMFYFGSSHKD